MARPRKGAKKKANLAVYLEPAMRKRLAVEAEVQHRSVSGQARLYIEWGLDGRVGR